MIWSYCRPFCQSTSLATAAALMLLVSAAAVPVRADATQQATLSDSAKSDGIKPATPVVEKSEQGTAPVDSANQALPANQAPADQAPPANQAQPKSLTDKAIEKVKQVAKSASDIFSRVPCLPPKGAPRSVGSLPHVAHKLAAGEPLVIVAFGSSSTQGYGATAPEMMKRLQTEVSDAKPDFVIWQVGTNAILRNLDPDGVAQQVQDGDNRIQ